MTGNRCIFLALVCAAALWADGSARLSYRIDAVAGSPAPLDGGLAVNAQLGSIQGVAVDGTGALYLADTDRHRVRRVGANGAITTVAGSGEPGFSGDGGPAAAARLQFPYGLAVDAAGNLYIADLGNQRIRRVDAAGVITTIAGNGQAGDAPAGALATEAPLRTPRNVAVSPAGEVYFSEFEGHRVRKLSGGRLVTVAGTGEAGSGESATSGAAQLNFPAGLAFDAAGALYIADTRNNRVRKVAPDGAVSTVLGGVGTPLVNPLAVAVDSAGAIYVADADPLVRVLKSGGRWANFAGTGAVGLSGDGWAATNARLVKPRDLAAVGGRVYIADGTRVRMVDPEGTITSVAGDAFLHAVGDGGAATQALLVNPSATAVDAAGNLYIADAGTHRVRRVSPAGIVSTWAGTGEPGYGPDPGPGTESRLNAPEGVAATLGGSVWIADTGNHRARLVDSAGRTGAGVGNGTAGLAADGANWPLAPLRNPAAACVSPAGAVYLVDTGNHRVLKAGSGAVFVAAGNGAAGFAGDGAEAKSAQLNQPRACAADAAGNLYIADTGNHRIRKVNAAGAIATVAGVGTAGADGDGAAATLAKLSSPQGVAVDGDGNLFIADTGNQRIRRVGVDGAIRTIAGSGLAGWSGDGGAATLAALRSPMGLAIDGSGAVYFADSGNQRVRKLTPIYVDPISALAATNAASMAEGPVAPGELVSLFGVGLGPKDGAASAFDAAGSLPTTLAGVQALFDGEAAPLLYVQAGQINVQAPYSIAGRASTAVQVVYNGETVGAGAFKVAAANPALFAVALNQDGALNSAANPAARGEIVVLYGTGEGLTDGPNRAGAAAQAPWPRPLLPVRVTVAGGALADVLYAGCAPYWAGLLQVNARLPLAIAPGQQSIRISAGSAASPEIAIWVK